MVISDAVNIGNPLASLTYSNTKSETDAEREIGTIDDKGKLINFIYHTNAGSFIIELSSTIGIIAPSFS
jgi:hypothetical protein